MSGHSGAAENVIQDVGYKVKGSNDIAWEIKFTPDADDCEDIQKQKQRSPKNFKFKS